MQAARSDYGNQFRPQRLRNALVLLQVGGCSLLLICAGILLRGSNRVARLDLGMNTRNIVQLAIEEKPRGRVLARLAAEPLVRKVAASSVTPLSTGFPSALASSEAQKASVASYTSVSPEFFQVLGIPIERGRNFTDDESRGGAPVAIISQTFARRTWPGAAAVGKTLLLRPDARSHLSNLTPLRFRQIQVIGVARDINTALVDDQTSRSLIYFPDERLGCGKSASGAGSW